MGAQQLCGDCDGDGFVSTVDALVAAQLAAELTPAVAIGDLLACDVVAPQAVRSGPIATPAVITILDALLIAQAAVGIPVLLSCV